MFRTSYAGGVCWWGEGVLGQWERGVKGAATASVVVRWAWQRGTRDEAVVLSTRVGWFRRRLGAAGASGCSGSCVGCEEGRVSLRFPLNS